MNKLYIETNNPSNEIYIWVCRRAYAVQIVSQLLFNISL